MGVRFPIRGRDFRPSTAGAPIRRVQDLSKERKLIFLLRMPSLTRM